MKINKIKLGNLDINDNFFDDLKEDYIEFEEWFNKKKDKEAYGYFENNKLLGLLVLKYEKIGDEEYNDIKPKMDINNKLKISTFKVDVIHKGIGREFINIVFKQAELLHVDEIYLTLFNNNYKKKNLISFFEKYGFKFYGMKNDKELVYIKYINN